MTKEEIAKTDSERIADALETLANIEKFRHDEYIAAQIVAKHMNFESWKHARLILSEFSESTCPYCDTPHVRILTRGQNIVGCSTCVGALFREGGFSSHD